MPPRTLKPPTMDERVTAFARLLGGIHEQELRLVKTAGWSLTEAYVLQILGLCLASTVTELAFRLSSAKSSVSSVVDSLTRAGLVKRSQRGSDRRTIALSLTARGRLAVDRFHVDQSRLLFEAASGLSPEESRLMDSLIERVASALERRRSQGGGR